MINIQYYCSQEISVKRTAFRLEKSVRKLIKMNKTYTTYLNTYSTKIYFNLSETIKHERIFTYYYLVC